MIEQIVKTHGRSATEGARVEVPYASMMARVYEDDHGALEEAHDVWQLTNTKQL
ncbi:hypothetical protein IID10_08850, partial [candidate division KSB1 bacterium]|nr:hypothetical protein [candidate division KSB1 bacterium]